MSQAKPETTSNETSAGAKAQGPSGMQMRAAQGVPKLNINTMKVTTSPSPGLPRFGGAIDGAEERAINGSTTDSAANVDAVVQEATPERSPDEVLQNYPVERQEIAEFSRVYTEFRTEVKELKDTMASYMPPFLARLQTIKKLCK